MVDFGADRGVAFVWTTWNVGGVSFGAQPEQTPAPERHVGALLKRLGFSHVSARPRHPGQNAEIVEAYKKTSRRR